MPHTRIQLKLQTGEGTVPLTAFVLRLEDSPPDNVLRYQAAAAFDRPLHLFDSFTNPAPLTLQPFRRPSSLNGNGVSNHEKNALLESLCSREADSAIIKSFLAVDICCDFDETHAGTFALNDW